MATLKTGQCAHLYRSIDESVQKKILDYMDSLPDGYILCSAELKELVFGEVPKERMIAFERMCNELIKMKNFTYIKRPMTNEYGQQRCYMKKGLPE